MTNSNPTPGPEPPTSSASAPRARRTWLIAPALAVGAVLLVGGTATALVRADPTADRPDPEVVLAGAQGPVAADYVAAIEDAVAAVDGAVGAESISRHHDGFEVEVRHKDGTEHEVRVGDDGRTEERGTPDPAERTPDPLLAAADVEGIMKAIEAHTPSASVTELSTDEDGPRFEAEFHDGQGTETEVRLDKAYEITDTQVDSDDGDHDDGDNDSDDHDDN